MKVKLTHLKQTSRPPLSSSPRSFVWVDLVELRSLGALGAKVQESKEKEELTVLGRGRTQSLLIFVGCLQEVWREVTLLLE